MFVTSCLCIIACKMHPDKANKGFRNQHLLSSEVMLIARAVQCGGVFVTLHHKQLVHEPDSNNLSILKLHVGSISQVV